jgi:hypothetical protein
VAQRGSPRGDPVAEKVSAIVKSPQGLKPIILFVIAIGTTKQLAEKVPSE